MIIIGLVVGLLTGVILLALVNDSPRGIFKDYTPIISIISVIIAYELSTALGGSGYMSCFIVGIVTGNKQNFKLWLSQKSYDADCHVVETLGTICRMCISSRKIFCTINYKCSLFYVYRKTYMCFSMYIS